MFVNAILEQEVPVFDENAAKICSEDILWFPRLNCQRRLSTGIKWNQGLAV
jgi:hypothetical protein